MKFCAFLVFLLSGFFSLAQTDSTSVLGFMVYNSKTGEYVEEFRLIMSGTDGSALDKVISSSAPEKFTLKVGYVYTISISAENYISISDRVDTNPNCFGTGGSVIYMREYFLEPIENICYITMPQFQFDFNSHTITKNMEGTFMLYLDLIVNNPELIFELRGYTSPEEYFTLGLKRATVIKNWLLENGVSEERLVLWWNSEQVLEMKTEPIRSPENMKFRQSVHLSII